jgi:septal ring factor EnvC (AmiA/AmiB activator)
MKRIALIVVIVACVASLALVWRVGAIKKRQKSQIVQLTDSLKETNSKLTSTKLELMTSKTERDQTREKLAATDAKLSAANVALDEKTKTIADMQAKVAESDKRTSDVTAKLTEVEGVLQKVKEALGVEGVFNVDQIRNLVTMQSEETRMLSEQFAKLRRDNAELKVLATTPEGLKGRVAVVETKWGFVVLNLGDVDKVRRNAQFIIYHDSKLIAKVQVTAVGPRTSIAQILPEYRHNTPRVGDQATAIH